MTNQTHPANPTGHDGYERTDVSAPMVVYFLVGLAIAVGITYFIADGFYHLLDKRFNAKQTPVSPLVTNAPSDTRHLSPQYKTDSEGRDYEKYLEKNFPQPQLETDERTELNKIRLNEEDTLSTYDYIDKSAGTVRIPIDRAMDLIVQRGLPVRSQSSATSSESKPAAKGMKQ
jgi:hypothetical protein